MLLCEVPHVHGNVSEINTTDKFSAYHIPNAGKRFEGHLDLMRNLLILQ